MVEITDEEKEKKLRTERKEGKIRKITGNTKKKENK